MTDIRLTETALFQGASPQEIAEMLRCLVAERRRFAKGEQIYRTGDVVASLGMVLSGSVLVERVDLWGNVTVLDSIGPGHIFAEAYACACGEPLMVDVAAAGPAEVLFLNMDRVLRTCPHACAHHNQLVRNLLTISAQKNLNLSRKIFHTSAKSIRGRLLAYLSDQAIRSGGRSFAIPFDRQQLADYLNVDRSALSHELGKMQREGLLRVRKNRFDLLDALQEHPFG